MDGWRAMVLLASKERGLQHFPSFPFFPYAGFGAEEVRDAAGAGAVGNWNRKNASRKTERQVHVSG